MENLYISGLFADTKAFLMSSFLATTSNFREAFMVRISVDVYLKPLNIFLFPSKLFNCAVKLLYLTKSPLEKLGSLSNS